MMDCVAFMRRLEATWRRGRQTLPVGRTPQAERRHPQVRWDFYAGTRGGCTCAHCRRRGRERTAMPDESAWWRLETDKPRRLRTEQRAYRDAERSTVLRFRQLVREASEPRHEWPIYDDPPVVSADRVRAILAQIVAFERQVQENLRAREAAHAAE